MKKLCEKYRSRIKSIVIPYICWCTIYYVYFVIISIIPFTRSMIGEEAVVTLSFIRWIRALWTESYYTLWFLKNLIIFIIVTPVLYVGLKNRNKLPIGTISLIIIVLNSVYRWFSLPSGIEMYALGSWLGINYKEAVLYKNQSVTRIAIIYIWWMILTGFRYYNVFTEILLFVSIWFALDIKKYNNEFPWWMKISFFTYVVHDIFLEVFEKVVWILVGDNPIWALLDYIFMPIIIFIFLVIIAYIMKKYFKSIWSILTGGR